jgi:hypothetical protein
MVLHQLQLPAPPAPCRRGCGRPAQVEVVDLPDTIPPHVADQVAHAMGQFDQPSTLQLCRPCAGEPAGWDAYRDLEGVAEQIARAA